MKIDLRRLFGGVSVEKEYSFTLPEETDGVVFAAPPAAVLKAKKNGGSLELTLAVEGVVRTHCDRCLQEMVWPAKAGGTWYLPESADLNDGEEQDLPLKNGWLDGEELARQELLASLPMVYHCSEDCEGLCPVCGRPKKEGCTCGQGADERFDTIS